MPRNLKTHTVPAQKQHKHRSVESSDLAPVFEYKKMRRCKIHEAAELADQVANAIPGDCQMSSAEVDSGGFLARESPSRTWPLEFVRFRSQKPTTRQTSHRSAQLVFIPEPGFAHGRLI